MGKSRDRWSNVLDQLRLEICGVGSSRRGHAADQHVTSRPREQLDDLDHFPSMDGFAGNLNRLAVRIGLVSVF